jgi:hypothetical protein
MNTVHVFAPEQSYQLDYAKRDYEEDVTGFSAKLLSSIPTLDGHLPILVGSNADLDVTLRSYDVPGIS